MVMAEEVEQLGSRESEDTCSRVDEQLQRQTSSGDRMDELYVCVVGLS